LIFALGLVGFIVAGRRNIQVNAEPESETEESDSK
jgi:hypothetical protein